MEIFTILTFEILAVTIIDASAILFGFLVLLWCFETRFVSKVCAKNLFLKLIELIWNWTRVEPELN